MRWICVVLSLSVVACGELSPDPPDSKLNNSTANADDGPQTSGNGATNGRPTEGDWEQYGTRGPSSGTARSPAGQAFCRLDDVRTSDLSEMQQTEVPEDGWDSVAVDTPGRCGDDPETLAWRLMNCERIGQDLDPFECDLRLVWLGRQHTLDMIARGYFSHDSPDGEQLQDRLDDRGVRWAATAENLSDATEVLEAHYGWMDSPGHRRNILGGYTHAGVGTASDGGRLISTTVFLTPP